jgi:hypothetical protein
MIAAITHHRSSRAILAWPGQKHTSAWASSVWSFDDLDDLDAEDHGSASGRVGRILLVFACED